MERREDKRSEAGFGILLAFGCFALVVLWTELNPSGVACGGVSTACGSTVRNISTGVEMYAADHDGQFPPDLQALVPDYLVYLPECSGTFNGCRARTVFGIRNALASLGEPRTGPAAVPTYETYFDAEGNPQYRVVCKRKHNGQKRYFSEGDRFEGIWDGQVKPY